MSEIVKHSPFRALVLITTPKLGEKASKMCREGAVPVQYKWHGVGTASSEMIDVLGLGSPDKSILISILSKPFADTMLKKYKKGLRLGTVNSGIAFTLPLTGANNLLVRMLEQLDNGELELMKRKDEKRMADTKYSLIAVVVNEGYSENVMEAARAVGAGGGTVVPSRRIGNEQAMGFWGMSIQNEKDMVFIVADNESKLKIMQEIGEKCGMHSEAKGIVVSLPIDNVIGFDSVE